MFAGILSKFTTPNSAYPMNPSNTEDMTARYTRNGLAVVAALIAVMPAFGQGMVNEDAKISVTSGTVVVIKDGGFTNNGASGQVTNAGTIEVDGDWSNNSATNVFGATPTASTGGTVILNGASQDISGSNRTHFYDLVAAGTGRKVLTASSVGSEAARIYNQVTLTTGVELNARTLTLENSSPTAIAGSGILVAETAPTAGSAFGILSWGIGNTTTGNYTIPFGTSSGASIPVTYNIVNAGNVTGAVSPYKKFSTYPTANDNTPFLPIVTHITDDYGNDNSSKVYDRFWLVDNEAQGNYGPNVITQYPNIHLTFKYLASELAGNTITEANLVAQRFNDIDERWGDWLYSPVANTATKTVTVNLTRIEDYFPIWTLVDNSDPLPIELARFVGQCQNGDVLVSWTTYTETNNDFFTLERSKNGIDFSVVDLIAAAGNSNTPITYQVLDESSFGGTSYYRLKTTDTYGHEEYSQVIAVTCGEELTDFSFVNAYDVDNRDLVVEFTAAMNEAFTVTLFDASGRMILNSNGRAIEGMNKVRIPTSNLSHGIYIVNLQNDSKRFSKKVMLK